MQEQIEWIPEHGSGVTAVGCQSFRTGLFQGFNVCLVHYVINIADSVPA